MPDLLGPSSGSDSEQQQAQALPAAPLAAPDGIQAGAAAAARGEGGAEGQSSSPGLPRRRQRRNAVFGYLPGLDNGGLPALQSASSAGSGSSDDDEDGDPHLDRRAARGARRERQSIQSSGPLSPPALEPTSGTSTSSSDDQQPPPLLDADSGIGSGTLPQPLVAADSGSDADAPPPLLASGGGSPASSAHGGSSDGHGNRSSRYYSGSDGPPGLSSPRSSNADGRPPGLAASNDESIPGLTGREDSSGRSSDGSHRQARGWWNGHQGEGNDSFIPPLISNAGGSTSEQSSDEGSPRLVPRRTGLPAAAAPRSQFTADQRTVMQSLASLLPAQGDTSGWAELASHVRRSSSSGGAGGGGRTRGGGSSAGGVQLLSRLVAAAASRFPAETEASGLTERPLGPPPSIATAANTAATTAVNTAAGSPVAGASASPASTAAIAAAAAAAAAPEVAAAAAGGLRQPAAAELRPHLTFVVRPEAADALQQELGPAVHVAADGEPEAAAAEREEQWRQAAASAAAGAAAPGLQMPVVATLVVGRMQAALELAQVSLNQWGFGGVQAVCGRRLFDVLYVEGISWCIGGRAQVYVEGGSDHAPPHQPGAGAVPAGRLRDRSGGTGRLPCRH